MKKLKDVFKDNTKTIADLTPEQAIILADIVFKGNGVIKWTITRVDKGGWWLNGEGNHNSTFYCHFTDYFEIFGSKTSKSSAAKLLTRQLQTEKKTFEVALGQVRTSWEYPYIQVIGWFLIEGKHSLDTIHTNNLLKASLKLNKSLEEVAQLKLTTTKN